MLGVRDREVRKVGVTIKGSTGRSLYCWNSSVFRLVVVVGIYMSDDMHRIAHIHGIRAGFLVLIPSYRVVTIEGNWVSHTRHFSVLSL